MKARALSSGEAPGSDAPWGAFAPKAVASAILWISRNTPLGRGLLRKVLFRLFSRFHAGPVDVELWGTPVRLHPALNVVERKALMRPDHADRPEHEVLAEVMARPGATFVDIGGNAGLYSLSAALAAKGPARILMVEPDASLISRLAFNFAEARRRGTIVPSVAVATFAVAISDREGEGVLSSVGDEGSRSLVPGTSPAGATVTLTTLAKLVSAQELSHIDIIKVDVEGHEDKVLPPFFAAVPQALWPRLIILEHIQRATWRPDCLQDALDRGYRVRFTTRNNTILERG